MSLTGATLPLPFNSNSEESNRREKKPAFRRLGTYLPIMIVMGLAITIMIYLMSMQMLGWKTPFIGARAAVTSVPSGSTNVYLYASPNSKNYFARIGANYEMLLIPWRHYFADRKIAASEITDPARLQSLSDGVLILPSAVALSTDERNQIARFRAKGGALLATWASGSRDENGEWQGWQFLEGMGAKVVGDIPAQPPARHLVLNGESPVSNTSPAGQRIWMGNAAEPFLRLKTVSGSMVAARIMNWARIPDHERRDEGAVLFSEDAPDKGRMAVYAFAESAWESQPQPIYRLVDDTLSWLQHTPTMVRAVWPNGLQAAQVIEMDTEEGFPNALRFAAMMQELNYHGTFYVLTSLGQKFPEVLNTLSRSFEIAYHGDVHDSFKGQPEAVQLRRIDTMKKQMATVVGDTSKITGFRAPTEGYDATTEKLLQQNGLRHHVTDPNRSDARLPLLVTRDGVSSADALIALPRTQRDDINLSRENLTAEQTTQALIDDFDTALGMGALGLLSVHSQNYASDSVLTNAMPAFLAHVKLHREQIWLASAGDVANWWRERERFKLSMRVLGKRQEFNISITGGKPLNGASIMVMLPQKNRLPQVQSIKVGVKKPLVRQLDPYRAVIAFDVLAPGDYAFQATFE